MQEQLFLGNLDAKRDWGHARDYVEGMWRIVQQDEPDDYVLATGRSHSVRYFVERAFAQVGIEIRWSARGIDERGIDVKRDRVLVRIDPRYFRPTEVDLLVGDASKAKARLGWTPTTTLEEMIAEMVREDIASLKAAHSQSR